MELPSTLLVARLLERLRPGGRLLVPNFALETPEAGCMEAVADWWLIYRDRHDMEALVPQDGPPIASVDIYKDETKRIWYADFVRG